MDPQQATLAQLEKAQAHLQLFIIGTNARPGTPQWAALQKATQQFVSLTNQINRVIAAAFQPGTAGLDAAIANLQQFTDALTALAGVLDNADRIIAIVDNIVQAATAILTIVGA